MEGGLSSLHHRPLSSRISLKGFPSPTVGPHPFSRLIGLLVVGPMDDSSQEDPERASLLESLGCFVNEEWAVRRLDDPDEKLSWQTPLEYDQLVRMMLLMY